MPLFGRQVAVGYSVDRMLWRAVLSEHAPEEISFGVGNLRILRRIGEGGFSSVFLATDTLLNRLVAVKVLRQHAQDASARSRFIRECAAVGRLSHPHVVKVYDAGFLEDERPYLTMEYAAAGDLGMFLRDRSIAAREAIALIAQIADALAYTHRLGIVHGDVKPANILLMDERQAALGDFGVARFISESTDDDEVSMSIPWAAPELMSGDATPGPAQDVYSLGATLYHMVVGHPPYVPSNGHGSVTLPEVVKRTLEGDIAPDPQWAQIDPHVRNLITEAMARDARERPSMQALAHALSIYATKNVIVPVLTSATYRSEPDETGRRNQELAWSSRTADRDISALLDIPQSAGSHTVIRKAAAIEERREAREYRLSGAVVSLTTVIVSLLSVITSIYEVIPGGNRSRDTALVSALSVAGAIAVVLLLSFVWRAVDRRRERTLRFRTLESAARVRSAYVRSLRLSALAPHDDRGSSA